MKTNDHARQCQDLARHPSGLHRWSTDRCYSLVYCKLQGVQPGLTCRRSKMENAPSEPVTALESDCLQNRIAKRRSQLATFEGVAVRSDHARQCQDLARHP